jgi:hypothetical protein
MVEMVEQVEMVKMPVGEQIKGDLMAVVEKVDLLFYISDI